MFIDPRGHIMDICVDICVVICVDILSMEHPVFYVALLPGPRVTKKQQLFRFCCRRWRNRHPAQIDRFVQTESNLDWVMIATRIQYCLLHLFFCIYPSTMTGNSSDPWSILYWTVAATARRAVLAISPFVQVLLMLLHCLMRPFAVSCLDSRPPLRQWGSSGPLRNLFPRRWWRWCNISRWIDCRVSRIRLDAYSILLERNVDHRSPSNYTERNGRRIGGRLEKADDA
jgi:hypothetical protein